MNKSPPPRPQDTKIMQVSWGLGAVTLTLLYFLLTGCASTAATPAPTPRPIATLFPTRAPPAPSARTTAPNSGWVAGSSGIELRHLQVTSADGKTAPLIVARLDPAQVRLRVAYAPDAPRPLSRWFSDSAPLLAVNGGYFTPEQRTTALLISDGAASGESYAGFGGMFAVGGDGRVALFALRDEAYNPDAGYAQALQSFPMLVFPGGVASAPEDNGARARRTAIALDRSGRLLIIVSPTSHFTLRAFADWLAASDLAIDRALNLDGGSSTGIFVNAGAAREQIDSFGRLPIVLLVEAK